MAGILRITDDTTTINFIGNDNYKLIHSSWAPRRAQRNQSDMGVPYNDVVETIPFAITGGSTDQIMYLYGVLSDLMDQAEAWGAGENVDAVKIVYQPAGSTLAAPVEAVILGAPGSVDMLEPPPTLGDAMSMGGAMSPVILSFIRRGQWLGATETETSSASTGNPAILTATTFTDSFSIPVPYDITVNLTSAGTSGPEYDLVVLTNNDAKRHLLAEGEDWSDVNMTDTVVATASGGYVKRTDTGSTSFVMSDTHSADVFVSKNGLIGGYIVAANNSSTISYTVQLGVKVDSNTSSFIYGPVINIDTSTTAPRIIHLGLTSIIPGDIRTSQLSISASSSVTTSNTLDIDYVCLTDYSDDSNYVQITNGRVAAAEDDIVIEHRLDSHRKPLVSQYIYAGPVLSRYLSYKGNAVPHTTGDKIIAMVIGKTAGQWILQDGGATEYDMELSVTRTAGYLTPL